MLLLFVIGGDGAKLPEVRRSRRQWRRGVILSKLSQGEGAQRLRSKVDGAASKAFGSGKTVVLAA